MHRKITQFLIVCLAYLSMVACQKLAGPSAKEVLSNYLDASLKGRYEEAYSYISSKDKSVKDLQGHLNDSINDDTPFAQAIASKVLKNPRGTQQRTLR